MQIKIFFGITFKFLNTNIPIFVKTSERYCLIYMMSPNVIGEGFFNPGCTDSM